MKYLVTGGTGFIGSGIVKRLVRDGHFVRSLDNDIRGKATNLKELGTKVEIVTGDIRDPKTVTDAAKGMESVIHLAYINGTEFFYSKPELVLDVAVRGMTNVIDACRKNNITELVLASSSEVYQTPPQVPTDESVPLSIPDILNPRYSYGGGKILCELMALNYGRTGIKRVLIFRPHNVYGPNMGFEHVIPQFVERGVNLIKEYPTGEIPFSIQGDGKQSRSFIYIDDFVDGVMCMLKGGEHLNIYHIGTYDELTIGEVAHHVVDILGRQIKLMPGPAPQGATPRRCPNIEKLKKLGFAPKFKLKDGLAPTVNWYKQYFSSNYSNISSKELS